MLQDPLRSDMPKQADAFSAAAAKKTGSRHLVAILRLLDPN